MIFRKGATHNTTVMIRATALSAVIASPLRRSDRARPPAPWLRRGGGALLLSAAVHAAAVGTIGGAIVSTTGPRSPGSEPETLDIDVAPVASTETNTPLPAPKTAAVTPAARRRLAARPAPSAGNAPAIPPPPLAPPAPDDARPARFVLSAGTIATNASPATGPATPKPPTDTGASPAAEGDAVREGEVDVPARLLAASPLLYPPAARKAEIEVDLPLEIVVDAAGRVVSARAVTRAGYGLDEAALHGIRNYRFSPAMRAGRAVPVHMRWTVQFRLR
jgi:protein TonB